jgi:hypothetical protein
LQARAAITHRFGPLDARLRLGLSRQIFEDVALSGGGSENNSDRNYTEPSLALRGTYTGGAQINPFAEVVYSPRFHDSTADRNGKNRDSHGISVTAGVVLDRGPIWTGELGVTYSLRDYADDTLDTTQAFGLNGNLTWRPTTLTDILLTASTTVNESASADTAGTVTWSGGVTGTHKLRENLDLIAGAGLSVTDTGSSLDATTTGKLAMDWQINPNLSWTAGYDLTWFDAKGSTDDWIDHRVSTGIVIRP